MILAVHFIVDAERRPAHAQSGFHCSLQWPPVTGTVSFAAVFLDIGDRALRHVMRDDLGSSTLPVRGQIGRNGE